MNRKKAAVRIARRYQRRQGARKVDPTLVTLRLAPFQNTLASDIQDVMDNNNKFQDEDKFVLGRSFVRMTLRDAETFENYLGTRGEAIEEGVYASSELQSRQWGESFQSSEQWERQVEKQMASWQSMMDNLRSEMKRARKYSVGATDPRYEILSQFVHRFWYQKMLDVADREASSGALRMPDNVMMDLSNARLRDDRRNLAPLWEKMNTAFKGYLDRDIYMLRETVAKYAESLLNNWSYPGSWKELQRWIGQDLKRQKKAIDKTVNKMWATVQEKEEAHRYGSARRRSQWVGPGRGLGPGGGRGPGLGRGLGPGGGRGRGLGPGRGRGCTQCPRCGKAMEEVSIGDVSLQCPACGYTS